MSDDQMLTEHSLTQLTSIAPSISFSGEARSCAGSDGAIYEETSGSAVFMMETNRI